MPQKMIPWVVFSSLYSWTSLRARLFALTAFSPWTLTEYARFESSSAVDVRHVCRPLMVRKVHIPLITPARPWPRHCIIVVSTKFSIPQFWYFTVGCVFVLWSWWCWVECRLIWRWGLIIVSIWICYTFGGAMNNRLMINGPPQSIILRRVASSKKPPGRDLWSSISWSKFALTFPNARCF